MLCSAASFQLVHVLLFRLDFRALIPEDKQASALHDILENDYPDYMDELKTKEVDAINKELRDGERQRADEQMRMNVRSHITQKQLRDQRRKLFDGGHGG